jgi:hypothetical protein
MGALWFVMHMVYFTMPLENMNVHLPSMLVNSHLVLHNLKAKSIDPL